jgi:predicted Zn finger-like uncharacterized protein
MEADSHKLSCPSCGSTYRYSSEKIDESGYVECQNCAKRFTAYAGVGEWVSEPIDDSDAIKPSIHFLSERVEGTRIECPKCRSTYIYTDEHRLESGMVSCQNCGSDIEAVGENILIVKERTGAQTQTENWAECVIVILILLFVPWYIAIPMVICYAVYKMNQSRDQTHPDSKVISRDSEGPGLG